MEGKKIGGRTTSFARVNAKVFAFEMVPSTVSRSLVQMSEHFLEQNGTFPPNDPSLNAVMRGNNILIN